jgi:hypothetical protein
MNPRHPVYIISKGRADSRLTSIELERMFVPYHIVIEPQEYDQYAAVIDPAKILTLPFSNLGQGSIPARNWVWEHSIEGGASHHWVLDDNIKSFRRTTWSCRCTVKSGTIFKLAEDYVDRFTNVAQAGFQYKMFLPRKQAHLYPPLYLNSRVYSCILIRNDIPLRWRGRYNEDTDLSLRILKAGWCTILFNAFLADKSGTMIVAGGNDDLYAGQGRLQMARDLVEQHPDVTRVVYKFGRWQHQVNYGQFRSNRLVWRPGVRESIPEGFDDHGLVLEHLVGDQWTRGLELPTKTGGRGV